MNDTGARDFTRDFKTLPGVYELPFENQHLDLNLYAFIHSPVLNYIIPFPALLPR